MSLGVSRGRLTGDTAVDDDVGLSITAETVAAVHAARDFTGCEVARDHLAAEVINLSLGVDLEPIVWCTAGVTTIA